MNDYLKSMYNLEPIDFIKLNKEKLAYIYNCSDIDSLQYMFPFLEGELKNLCERMIILNQETDLGWGREPADEDEQNEYIDGKWRLLEHFGIESDLGNAYVPNEKDKR